VTEATSGPGQTLRLEREALGVTVREVADTLNLSITVVQALEADDYARLPGTVFARGYIRAYARLLDLDPAPLLERYPSQGNTSDLHPVSRDVGLAEWIRRRPGLVLSILALIVIVVLGALAKLLWPEDGIESLWRSVDTPTVTVPPASAGAGDWQWEAEEPADAAVDAAPAPAAGPATEADEAIDAETAAPGGPGATVVEGTPVAGADGEVQRLTETGDQRLQLDFSADSWVEIRSPDGRVLYSNLNRGGTGLELVGQGPFRILLGYAPGVTLAFEGEQVALAPHTRNNVATLVLGQ
jgi:cytoskeleton protein RodZ